MRRNRSGMVGNKVGLDRTPRLAGAHAAGAEQQQPSNQGLAAQIDSMPHCSPNAQHPMHGSNPPGATLSTNHAHQLMHKATHQQCSKTKGSWHSAPLRHQAPDRCTQSLQTEAKRPPRLHSNRHVELVPKRSAPPRCTKACTQSLQTEAKQAPTLNLSPNTLSPPRPVPVGSPPCRDEGGKPSC